MKRMLQVLVPILILASACTKEKSIEHGVNDPDPGSPGGGNNPTYFLKCKIGGTAKTFNVIPMAFTEDDGNGGTATIVVGKATSDPNDLESFSFAITSSAALKTGTYKVDYIGGDYQMGASYTPSGASAVVLLTSTGLPFGTPFRVTITSISSTEIAGTFSGSLFEIDLTNPNPSPNIPEKAVTEGEFKVKFQ